MSLCVDYVYQRNMLYYYNVKAIFASYWHIFICLCRILCFFNRFIFYYDYKYLARLSNNRKDSACFVLFISGFFFFFFGLLCLLLLLLFYFVYNLPGHTHGDTEDLKAFKIFTS